MKGKNLAERQDWDFVKKSPGYINNKLHPSELKQIVFYNIPVAPVQIFGTMYFTMYFTWYIVHNTSNEPQAALLFLPNHPTPSTSQEMLSNTVSRTTR